MPKFYITTTLPYVNSNPHIGFAWEVVRADALARFKRQNGDDVFFNTGTDEHGLKIFRKAEELGISPQEYCDQQLAKWQELKNSLNLSYDNFIRTTDEYHIKAAQEFWRQTMANGYIYKKQYKVKYCVGCELEKTESELVNGKCPLHSSQELEIIEEENYFFRFSVFAEKLSKLYQDNPQFVVPEKRFNEIKKFVEMGLEDFSISRLKAKMPWGIEVPDDPDQVIYVWFDALINYISTIKWPNDSDFFNSWWPGVQVAGKDNLRQQSAMWQAMLFSVGLPPSKQIYINSFLTSGGQKMSKSSGNIIEPGEMIAKFGTEGSRYLLLAINAFGEDTDITWENMAEKYNADLANGLGNLVARVSNLLEKNDITINMLHNSDGQLVIDFIKQMEIFRTDEALKILWSVMRESDETLTKEQPWKLIDKNEMKKILEPIAQNILNIAFLLKPLLPDTSEKLIQQFNVNKVKKGESLFPRI